MTIFDIASRHGRRIGWYAGGVVFAVLFASYILPQSEPKAPPFALTVGYLMVAVGALLLPSCTSCGLCGRVAYRSRKCTIGFTMCTQETPLNQTQGRSTMYLSRHR